jgi:hypothetical protein
VAKSGCVAEGGLSQVFHLLSFAPPMFYSKYSLLAHHLKSITNQNEHQIRLSKDDNPPAHKFLVDDYGDDNGHLNNSDDELLLKHVKQATQALRHRTNDE